MSNWCVFHTVLGQQDHFQTPAAKGKFQDMQSDRIQWACLRGMSMHISRPVPERAGLPLDHS